MPNAVAPYLMAVFAMLFAAGSAIVLITIVGNLDHDDR